MRKNNAKLSAGPVSVQILLLPGLRICRPGAAWDASEDFVKIVSVCRNHHTDIWEESGVHPAVQRGKIHPVQIAWRGDLLSISHFEGSVLHGFLMVASACSIRR